MNNKGQIPNWIKLIYLVALKDQWDLTECWIKKEPQGGHQIAKSVEAIKDRAPRLEGWRKVQEFIDEQN